MLTADADAPSRLPPMLHAPIFALLFFWLVLALGDRALKWLRLTNVGLTAWERGLLAACFGAGFVQLLPLALAAGGVMTRGFVRVAALVLALGLLPDAWRVARAIARVVKGTISLPRSRAAWLWLALSAALLFVLFVHALTFGRYGDDDGYHLSAPARWLRDGTLSYLPTYTHTNAAMGFEMLYVIALSFGEALGAKLLHFGCGLLTLGAVVACARRLGDWAAGVLAISVLLIANPAINLPYLFTVAYVDFPACFATLAGVLVWLVWRESREPRLIVALGLCAGFTGSFKFTALSVCIVWCLVIVIELKRLGSSLAGALPSVIKFGLIAAAPILPWLARNAILTGNPLYPMFSSIVPTRDWTPEHAAVFGRYIKYYAWGVGSGARLSESKRKLLLAAAVGLVLVVTGALVARARQPALRLLSGFAGAYMVVCIALTGLLVRYFYPGDICFVLVAAMLALPVARRFGHVHAPALAALAVAVAVQIRAETKERGPEVWPGSLGRDARLAVGVSQPEAEFRGDSTWEFWQYIGKNTPKDARVLFAAYYTTFGASSFGCFPISRVCYTTDSHLQTYLRLDDWSKFVTSVRGAGIEYMVISKEQFTAGRHGFTFEAGKNEYPFCKRLAEEYGEKLFESGSLMLYRLRLGASPART